MGIYDRVIETLILLAVCYEAIISQLHYEHSVLRSQRRKLTLLLKKLGIRS